VQAWQAEKKREGIKKMRQKINFFIDDIDPDWPLPLYNFDKTAENVIDEFGEVLALEHVDDLTKVAYITPSAKYQNQWQVSYADKLGFWGDSTKDTPKEALAEAIIQDYCIIANEYH
jgi:hypothetical protein